MEILLSKRENESHDIRINGKTERFDPQGRNASELSGRGWTTN